MKRELKKKPAEESLDESSPEGGVEEDTTDEYIPEYLFKLFIADRGNSRVAVWNELPIMPEEEEKEQDDFIEIEDANLLIGEDEDDDYLSGEDEDDQTTPPEELPSV